MNCDKCKHAHFYIDWRGLEEYWCDRRMGTGSTFFTDKQKRKMCTDDTTGGDLFDDPFIKDSWEEE